MTPQSSGIQSILETTHLCDFSNCINAPDLNSLLTAPDATQYLGTNIGLLISDLTVLAALEFALVRVSYGPRRTIVSLPMVLAPNDVWLGITKYDTTDTKPCETAARIINGQIFPVDLFLFTGDLQKYEKLVASGTPLELGLEQLRSGLPNVLQPRIKTLARYLTRGMWWDFQQLVWKLRLLIMREAHTGVSKESAIRDAIRDFRNDWLPPSNFGGGSSPSGYTPSGGDAPPEPLTNVR